MAGAGYWALVARTGQLAYFGQAATAVTAATTVALAVGQPLAVALSQRGPALSIAARWAATRRAAALAATLAVVVTTAAIPVLTRIVHLPTSAVLLVALVLAAAGQAVGLVLDPAALVSSRPWLAVRRTTTFGIGKLIALGIVATMFHLSAAIIVGTWAVAAVLTSAWALHCLRPSAPLPEGREWELAHAEGIAALRHRAGMHTAGVLSSCLPGQALPLLVAAAAGTAAAGKFTLSWLISGLLLMAVTSICAAMLSSGSHDWRPASVIMAAVLIVGMPALWFAGPVILHLLRPDLTGATWTLHLLVLSALPSAVGSIGVAVLRSRQLTAAAALVSIVEAVVVLGVATLAATRGAGTEQIAGAWLIGQLSSAALGSGMAVSAVRRERKLCASGGRAQEQASRS